MIAELLALAAVLLAAWLLRRHDLSALLGASRQAPVIVADRLLWGPRTASGNYCYVAEREVHYGPSIGEVNRITLDVYERDIVEGSALELASLIDRAEASAKLGGFDGEPRLVGALADRPLIRYEWRRDG